MGLKQTAYEGRNIYARTSHTSWRGSRHSHGKFRQHRSHGGKNCNRYVWNADTDASGYPAGDVDKATGWEIEWRKFASGAEVIAAMASGDLKISEIGSSPLAIGASQGVDYQLFGIFDVIGAAEALIARDGSGIAKAEDLKGKKVAVPLGSTAHYSLMGAIKNAGLAPGDVEVIGMKPDQITAAWDQGQIDATFIWEPARGRAMKTGKMIVAANQVTGAPTFDG